MKSRKGRETMSIRLDFSNMMASAMGKGRGIEDGELEALHARTEVIHQQIMSQREKGFYPFFDLPFDQDQIEQVIPLADDLAGRFDNVVVLGIGGSALGTTALFNALCPIYHNLLDQQQRRGRPRLFILDNVDPSGFGEALALLEPARTVFLVISKSGSTVETMCQFMIAQDWIRKRVEGAYQDHFVIITDPVSGPLRQLATDEGFRSCSIPEKVGGRFSVFTPVGLLPLAAVGVDIRELLAGAASFAERVTHGDLMTNPAYLNAALQYLAYRKGMPISVMMPYSDRLRDVADWYRQMWAESLGKKESLQGETVHVGPTPVKALGTTDQHSQVQLYMEGPFDKVVTFIIPDDYGTDVTIPAFSAAPALNYLAGKSLTQLIRSEYQATVLALTRNGRLNCTLSLPAVNPHWVGALIYMFEVQTLFAGGLFEVNPLDQPGVELGKEYTYALMGKPGFEQAREGFDRFQEGLRRYILE
jgi:glucose-6-phosphate isomerase